MLFPSAEKQTQLSPSTESLNLQGSDRLPSKNNPEDLQAQQTVSNGASVLQNPLRAMVMPLQKVGDNSQFSPAVTTYDKQRQLW